MKHYLRLMRPKHYVKNVLVLAPLACSGQLLDPGKLVPGLLAFLAYCFASSAVYILNDIRDAEKDRNHPVKCRRPIASGAVSVRGGAVFAGSLLALAALCNGMIFRFAAAALLLCYLVLNLGYSFGLKNVPLLDVTILSAGFLLRILYGAAVTGIRISGWLYLTVLVFAFYFSLGKRRNELRHLGDRDTRSVLQAYPPSFLDKAMGMCLTLGNVFYALWTMDSATAALYGTQNLVFTVPIVLLITLKYSLNVEGNSDGDPVEVLLGDKFLLLLCAGYLAAMLVILYG